MDETFGKLARSFSLSYDFLSSNEVFFFCPAVNFWTFFGDMTPLLAGKAVEGLPVGGAVFLVTLFRVAAAAAAEDVP